MKRAIWLLPALGFMFLSPPATASDKDPKGIEFFESKIRPVLIKNCLECHSTQSPKVKGGLYLDSRDGMRKGGDSGPAVVPGSVEKSLIIQALRHEGMLEMPPKKRLTDNVVADFVAWVKMGAPDPRDGTSTAWKKVTVDKVREFWSFNAPKKPALPDLKDGSWARGDIDRFILAKLQAKNLRPVADADRHSLVRRLYFDLIGLPPSPTQLDAFVNDKSPQAVEKLVDELLASEHFGERWGRYWLDIARYAESNGNADNTAMPNAWRYRDYVIGAFNQDKPYNRFITEQIAGDLLKADDDKTRDQHLVATAFLALTSKPRAQNNPDFKMDLVADQIDVTTKAILGLTVMCARCHDHKFDPIPTKEYYALAGIFDSSLMLFGGPLKGGGKGFKDGGFHTLSGGLPAMGVRDGKPVDTAICVRGESQTRGETVKRGFLTAATISPAPEVNRTQSGRLELADWLTKNDNPLTARVMVNRLWVHLFGRGLVPTVDNFGVLGETPSHPELLDHLAIRFMEDGWSVKKAIRTMVLSRTYQLSTAHDAANYKADPDNIWRWRMSARRLDAEALRDAILFVSGKIALAPPGKSLMDGVANPKKKIAGVGRDLPYRSVYLPMLRNALPEALAVFDIADPSLVIGQREITTVPAQALWMMNSAFVIEQSGLMAARVLGTPDADDGNRVDHAYRLAFARPASQSERERTLAYLRQTEQTLGGNSARDQAWASFCQALIASAEFRYIP
jgi:hypothetical protein